MSYPTIETDLGKILERIEQNLAEFRKETNQRFEQLSKEITEIKIGQARLDERMTGLEEDIKDIRGSQKAQIWALITILATAVFGAIIRFVIIAMPSGNP
jgi:predicted  nucleic acid-binding Zn-ribbon protein